MVSPQHCSKILSTEHTARLSTEIPITSISIGKKVEPRKSYNGIRRNLSRPMTGSYYKTVNDENQEYGAKRLEQNNAFRMKRRSEQKSYYPRFNDRNTTCRLGLNHKPSGQQARKTVANAADSTNISGRPGSRYAQPLTSGMSNINRSDRYMRSTSILTSKYANRHAHLETCYECN